jgi:Domain of unknown function (DUF4384)
MKKLFATLLVLASSLISLAHPGTCDRIETGEPAEASEMVQGDAQTKDMYLAYAYDSKKKTKKRRGRPGAKVRVELRRDGVTGFVPIDTTFQAGDKVKFHFAVNFPAHVSVINLGSSGRLNLLFPYQGAPEVVGITQNYTVPQSNDLWFEFDSTPGTERLTFVFSAMRVTPSSAPSSQSPAILAAGGSVAVNASRDQQAALDDLNSRALANGRDLNLVRVSSEENYVLCDEQLLSKPVGFQITLKHR